MKRQIVTTSPTIIDAAQRLRDGQLTATALIDTCIRRIEELDPTIQAWVEVDIEKARENANHLDTLAAQGTFAGPLHGIPVGIKDIIDVAGLPTRAGSPLQQDHRADQDAKVVELLRQAGAIPLGKTVTCEWACFDPAPTLNPWNADHTPGGSSAGSAAAVAAGMCPAAIGTQTGGSITRPAAYCGTAGFKPTFNSISTSGVAPVSVHLDHVGFFARSIADLRLLQSALAQSTTPHPSSASSFHFSTVKALFSEADREYQSICKTTVDSAVGSTTEFVFPCNLDEVRAMHYRIMARGAADVHRSDFLSRPDAFGPNVGKLIEDGLRLSDTDHHEALNHQTQFKTEMDKALPPDCLLIAPATPAIAPRDLGTTGDPKFNSPWSYAGLPVVSFPCERTLHGLPVSLQFIGPRNSDNTLLEAVNSLFPQEFPIAPLKKAE